MSKAAKPTPQDIQALRNSVAVLKAVPQDKREAQKVHFHRTLDAARETGLLLIKLKVQQGGKRRRANSPNVGLKDDADRVPTLRELELTDRESIFCKEVAGLTPARLVEIKADVKVTTKIAFQRAAYPEKYAAKAAAAPAESAPETLDQADAIARGCELLRRAFGGGLPEAAEETLKLSPQKRRLIQRVLAEAHEFEDALETARTAPPEPVTTTEHKAADTGTGVGVQ